MPVRQLSLDSSRRLVLVLLALGMGLVYTFGTSQVYTYADDSLPFVLSVNTQTDAVVHHLVLGVLGEINRALGFFGSEHFLATLFLFKAYVVLTSVLGLLLVGLLSLRSFGSLFAALVSMLCVGFAFGYWSYSIVPDLYVPALAFVLLAVYCAERSYEGKGFGWLLLAALALLAAALNHQSHSLAVLPIAAVLLWWRRDGRSSKARAGRAAFFVAASAVFGLGAFYGAYQRANFPAGFIAYVRGYEGWMTAYMPTDRLQARTPIYMGIGLVRALFFPEVLFHFDAVHAAAESHFELKLLGKFRYLVRDLPAGVVVLALAGMALLCTLLPLAALARWRSPRRPSLQAGLWMLSAWIPLQALFTAWWLASSREFWIWGTACLGLVGVGWLVAGGNRRVRAAASVGVAVLVLVNGVVVSRCWRAENCLYRSNKSYLASTQDQDLVLTSYIYSVGELEHLVERKGRIVACDVGAFSMADSLFQEELARVRRTQGRIVLDPMLVMPDAVEAKRTSFYKGITREAVEAQLLLLEEACREAQIPLLAVERQGAETLRFRRLHFAGHAQWTDGRLQPRAP